MNTIQVRDLGLQDYTQTYHDMVRYTDNRTGVSPDEIWFVEHEPVYTLGLNGNTEHIIDAGMIPVIKTDRGGQVSYHGPGQSVVYLLIDLKRKKIPVKKFVNLLEQSVIDMLEDFKISAQRRTGAPGVYIDDKKIAALGIRVRRGCSYHGIAVNVDMDISPFSMINPCGYPGLEVTRLIDFDKTQTTASVREKLLTRLIENLGYPSATRPGDKMGGHKAIERAIA